MRGWNRHYGLIVVVAAAPLSAAPPPKPKPRATPKIAVPVSPAARLLAAITRKDAAQVRLALKDGADPNGTNEEATSMLALAASLGSAQICGLLIDRGAKLDPDRGDDPLASAIINGHTDVVRVLLDRGADPNSPNEHGISMLSFSITFKRMDILNILLERGAKPDGAALLSAVEADVPAVVTLILDRGVDINARDEDGMTALIAAAAKDLHALAELLVRRGAELNAKDGAGENALIIASKSGSLRVAELLVKRGADVNAKDNIGKTALMHAAGEQRAKMVALLKAAGAREFEPTLEEAAKQGDARMVRALLDRGVDPNLPDADGRTPLFHAVLSDENCVNALLEKGANPNARDRQGQSVISAATRRGNDTIVALLVEAGADAPNVALVDGIRTTDLEAVKEALLEGADPNALDTNGQPALILSIVAPETEQRTAIFRLLLDKGAKPNVPDSVNGFTPLINAASSGSLALVQELLARGADPAQRDNEGNSPLMFGGGEEVDAIIRLLIARGADVRAKNRNGRTALHDIAQKAGVDTLRAALDRGAHADINARDQHGQTPLLLAASHARADNVRLLLDRGADPSIVETFGRSTPLIMAIDADQKHEQRMETVRVLLKHGVNPNTPDKLGRTPLQAAKSGSQFEIIELLKRAGATSPQTRPTPHLELAAAIEFDDLARARRLLQKKVSPNAPDRMGYTPLMTASQRGSLEAVRLLLAHGARPRFAPLRHGIPVPTPLHLAAEYGRLEIVRLLLKHGADANASFAGDSPLMEAAKKNHYDVCRELIARGAAVNAQSVFGMTALTIAVSRGGDPRVIKLLIQKGASVNVRDRAGWTPLLMAAATRGPEIMDILLAAGADPKAISPSGESALILAAGENNLDVIQILLSRGVDVNLKDDRNRTALSVAQDNGHTDAAELLKRSGARP